MKLKNIIIIKNFDILLKIIGELNLNKIESEDNQFNKPLKSKGKKLFFYH